MTLPEPNDGTRPSRLLLDRYLTSELPEPERLLVEGSLDERARAHLAEVAATEPPPLDLRALRDRAAGVDSLPAPLPARANTWLPFLALAAIVLLSLTPLLVPREAVPEGYVGVRGGADLDVFLLDDGQLHPWEGDRVGEGDVLGFKVRATADGVVLLGVDGTGRVSVYWPEAGERPEPLPADGALPGSIVLDGAPGPEVFVAVFDTPVGEARRGALEAWRAGGADAVLRWAEAHPEADAVRVERR